MNNIMVSLKKFITNKNTVTILGVLAILVLLYVGYNKTIEDQTKPIEIPVATRTIQPRELITDDMLTYITVPEAMLSENVVRVHQQIIGKYADINTVIPAGSMFYTDVLITKAQLPDKAFIEVKDGERPYALSVTTESTYGNSIFPNSKIDVYMKATDETGQVMIGRLLEKVEVLAVKDSMGENVFENTAETRTPATLLFGVEDKVFILLKAAEYLSAYGVELFPVPYGGTATIEGDLVVDREELVDFITTNATIYSEQLEDLYPGTEMETEQNE